MILQLIGNSISSMMVPLVKMGITFVMAPVIVHALGNYDYGIWEIVFSIVGYMGMLDLGLTPAIVRNVARQSALGNQDELRRIFSSSIAFFLPVGLLMSIAILVSAFWSRLFFDAAPESAYYKYPVFLSIIAIQVFFTFVGTVFDSFLEGFQKYNIRNYATIISSLVGAAILYPLLKNGGGLLVLAAGNALGYSIKSAWYCWQLSRPHFGGFRFNRTDVSRSTFRGLFNFGVKSFIYASSFSIGHFMDSIILGYFLGPVAVAFYVIPVNLLSHLRNLIWQMTRVFMPLFSELDALAEKDQTSFVFLNSSRYALGLIFPLMGGAIILGPPFLHHWIGENYAINGRWILYIMASAYLFQFLCPFRNRFLTGIGRLEVQALVGVCSVILNFIISITMVKVTGKEGVAIGTLAAAIVFEPYLLWFTCRAANCDLAVYIRRVYFPLIAPNILFIAFLITALETFHPQSPILILLIGAIGVIFYVPIFFMLSVSRTERNRILNIVLKRPVTSV